MDGTGSWQNHGEAETWEGEDTTTFLVVEIEKFWPCSR